MPDGMALQAPPGPRGVPTIRIEGPPSATWPLAVGVPLAGYLFLTGRRFAAILIGVGLWWLWQSGRWPAATARLR